MGKSARSDFELDLYRLLLRYLDTVEDSDLVEKTKDNYRVQAMHFFRWAIGDFSPGDRERNQQSNDLRRIRELVQERQSCSTSTKSET